MSYTLHVPATPEQIRALAAIIAREVPDRTRRIKLRFGTCTMLPPTTAEEAQFPGTVSAAYALKMLGEAAVCLAKDPLDSEPGVTTPSVAMGPHLIERLRAAGMTFEVKD